MKEFGTDPVIETDATRDILNIGTNNLTQVSHFIDEGDFGRKKGIRRIFDQFSSAPCSEQDWRLIEKKRAINIAHNRARAVILSPNDDPVRALEITNRGPFAQKFRVGYNRPVNRRCGLTQDAFNLIPRPNGNG